MSTRSKAQNLSTQSNLPLNGLLSLLSGSYWKLRRSQRIIMRWNMKAQVAARYSHVAHNWSTPKAFTQWGPGKKSVQCAFTTPVQQLKHFSGDHRDYIGGYIPYMSVIKYNTSILVPGTKCKYKQQ